MSGQLRACSRTGRLRPRPFFRPIFETLDLECGRACGWRRLLHVQLVIWRRSRLVSCCRRLSNCPAASFGSGLKRGVVLVGSRCARAVDVVEFNAILDTIQRAVTEFDQVNVLELLDALIREVIAVRQEQHYHKTGAHDRSNDGCREGAAGLLFAFWAHKFRVWHTCMPRLATRAGGRVAHGTRRTCSPLGGFQIICREGPLRTRRAPLAGREGARIAFKAFHLVHCTAGQTCDGNKRPIVWCCEYPLTLLCFEVRNIPFISGS